MCQVVPIKQAVNVRSEEDDFTVTLVYSRSGSLLCRTKKQLLKFLFKIKQVMKDKIASSFHQPQTPNESFLTKCCDEVAFLLGEMGKDRKDRKMHLGIDLLLSQLWLYTVCRNWGVAAVGATHTRMHHYKKKKIWRHCCGVSYKNSWKEIRNRGLWEESQQTGEW